MTKLNEIANKSKFFLCGILAVFLIFFFSCKKEKHLKFSNIEMKGTIPEFVSKLKKTGFEELVNMENTYMLNGKYLNKDCAVIITQKDEKNVS